MEDNQIKDTQAPYMALALRSASPDSIVPLVPVGGTPHTLGSLQTFPEGSYYVYHLPDGTTIISAYGQPWKHEAFLENQIPDTEANHAANQLPSGSPLIQWDQYLQNTGASYAGTVATMADIALENRHQTDSLFDDAPTEDLSGIFTFSRSPNVIFSTSIDLSSRLQKMKPYISPHDLSID